MPSYNIKAIQDALNKVKTKGSGSEGDSKVKYFKPDIGVHNIRILPYSDPETGMPFQEVYFYDTRKLSKYRMVAPHQYGQPDPIRDLWNEERKTREGWMQVKDLKPRDRYFANVIVRKKDGDEGPMVWEFSRETRDEMLKKLILEDFQDEDLFSPETGHDFSLTVTQAKDASNNPREFNGYPVKKLSIDVRAKASPLSKDKTQATKWLTEAPNLRELFEARLPSTEQIEEALETFAKSLVPSDAPSPATDAESTEIVEQAISEAEKRNEAKLAGAFGL